MPARTSRKSPRTALFAGAITAALAASVLVASTASSRPTATAAGGETSVAGVTVVNAVATASIVGTRKVEPREIAQTLRIAGLTPENLAAAGVGRLEFDDLADTALVYCTQADRVAAYANASKNLNIMRANATKIPAKRTTLEGQGAPTTLAQAQGQLDDLKNNAFSFITTGMDSGKKAKLTTIRANAKRDVPAPYKLLTERTDKQWLELRNALTAKRIALKKDKPVPQSASTIVSAAEADTAVAASKASYAANLAIIKDEWNVKMPRGQGQNDGPP